VVNGIFNALSGLRTSAGRLQNSANNLANIETSGFKKSTVTVGEAKSGGSQLTSIRRVNVQGDILLKGNLGASPNGTILSSSFKISNVDILKEMADQVTTQVVFTSNAKITDATDQIIGAILDIKS